MIEGIKGQSLAFDRGIDGISHRRGEVDEHEALPSDPLLPSEDGMRPRLDEVIRGPSLEDGIRHYLTPTVTNRETLRPSVHGAMAGEIRDTVRAEAARGGDGQVALRRLGDLLDEQRALTDMLGAYRSALHRA